ncbi:hypothetical protein ACFYY5_29500 [Nocardia elegans]|uniref:Uncharacterized protein n=1 Tax=Nocardia elegans TaxID=300029 RepID=A0ABW6TLH7_9NOCA
MSLNDQIGDCTGAGAGHFAQAINWYGQHKDAPVSDADVLAFYEAISGYQPGKSATDVGATLQDALKQWHQVGIGGNKIAAYAQIKASDLATIRACISLFGGVYVGMNFPASAMDQFNKGQEWTVVSRSRIEGGHCITLGTYDSTSFAGVTWGAVQKMTVDFVQRYIDEFWVPIDLDWLTAQGVSPAAIDGATLNADYQALTGQPGPFPVITPAPTPNPAPTPAPATNADAALLAAFTTWKTAKGL